MDKDILKALDTLNEGNPFATFLNQSSLSVIDKWIDTGCYVLNAIMSGKMRSGAYQAVE